MFTSYVCREKSSAWDSFLEEKKGKREYCRCLEIVFSFSGTQDSFKDNTRALTSSCFLLSTFARGQQTFYLEQDQLNQLVTELRNTVHRLHHKGIAVGDISQNKIMLHQVWIQFKISMHLLKGVKTMFFWIFLNDSLAAVYGTKKYQRHKKW